MLTPDEYERFKKSTVSFQRGGGKLDRKRDIEEASTRFDKRPLYVDRDLEVQKKKTAYLMRTGDFKTVYYFSEMRRYRDMLQDYYAEGISLPRGIRVHQLVEKIENLKNTYAKEFRQIFGKQQAIWKKTINLDKSITFQPKKKPKATPKIDSSDSSGSDSDHKANKGKKPKKTKSGTKTRYFTSPKTSQQFEPVKSDEDDSDDLADVSFGRISPVTTPASKPAAKHSTPFDKSKDSGYTSKSSSFNPFASTLSPIPSQDESSSSSSDDESEDTEQEGGGYFSDLPLLPMFRQGSLWTPVD